MAMLIDGTIIVQPTRKKATSSTSSADSQRTNFNRAMAKASPSPKAPATSPSNPPGDATGAGSMTSAEIRHFQAINGLTVDGIVGPETKAAMAAEAADGNAASSSPDVVAYNTTEPHPNFPSHSSSLDTLNPAFLNDSESAGQDPSRPASVFNPPASESVDRKPTSQSPTDAAHGDAAPLEPKVQDHLEAEEADARVVAAGNDYDRYHFINPRTGREYTDAEVRQARENSRDSYRQSLSPEQQIEYDQAGHSTARPPTDSAYAETPEVVTDYLEAKAADARIVEAGDNYDRYHFINPRTGREYTDAEVRYVRETVEFREGLSSREQAEFDNLFYEIGIDFNFDDAVAIVGEYWHDVFNVEGSGMRRENLLTIAQDQDDSYTAGQRAAAYYFLSRPGDLHALDSNNGSGFPNYQGVSGDNIVTAGGEIGPSRRELLDAAAAELHQKEQAGSIPADYVNSGLVALGAIADLSPAEYEDFRRKLIEKTTLTGQTGVVLLQAAAGDTDGAFESAFDALLPAATKHILAKGGATTLAGPVGLVLSIMLTLGPLDTSETRVAAASERNGEYIPGVGVVSQGGFGTNLEGVMNSQNPPKAYG